MIVLILWITPVVHFLTIIYRAQRHVLILGGKESAFAPWRHTCQPRTVGFSEDHIESFAPLIQKIIDKKDKFRGCIFDEKDNILWRYKENISLDKVRRFMAV